MDYDTDAFEGDTDGSDSEGEITAKHVCALQDIAPGDMLIVKLDPALYEGIEAGEDRIQRRGRRPLGGGVRMGAAKESKHLIWRLAEVIDTKRATPTAAAALDVVFWETYDHRLDLTKRRYARAFVDAQGTEVYSNQYRFMSSPTWQQMNATVGLDQLLTRPFRLTARHCLPTHVCRELVPYLAIHLVLCPATVQLAGGGQEEDEGRVPETH